MVAGGLIAGVTGVTGAPDAAAEPVSVLEARFAAEEDAALLPQAAISVAEAEARLAEVAA
ncbi:M23 family peptidase, partial [Mycobacterium sp. PS03-16]